ncbi:MAG: hypothetical protein GY757_52210, partial [bacterium]|nr:hypothetical protein [bacterium]
NNESGAIRRLLLLFVLVGLAATVTYLVREPAPADLDLHFEDKTFHSNLKGKMIKITIPGDDSIGTFEIEKKQDDYTVSLKGLDSETANLCIKLDGYQTVELTQDLLPGQKVVKNVSLTPLFGSLKVGQVNRWYLEKPIHQAFKVKVAGVAAEGIISEGVAFPVLPPGKHIVETESEGWGPQKTTVSVEPAHPTVLKYPYTLKPGKLKVYAVNSEKPDIPLQRKLTVKTEGREISGKAAEGVIINYLPSGSYHIEAKIEDFFPLTENADILSGQTTEVELRVKAQFGALKVFAENAKEPSKPIQNPLRIKIGGKEFSGSAVEGIPVENLVSGQYHIDAEVEGFSPGAADVEVTAGETAAVRILLSPDMVGDELVRIILEWDEHPRDVDSHLYLPGGSAVSNHHVFYSAKESMKGNSYAVNLDVDDTNSYGPETTTIFKNADGVYRFCLHHYAGVGTLGSSGSKVK